jgi:uncharacterized phage-like protein YoqJ
LFLSYFLKFHIFNDRLSAVFAQRKNVLHQRFAGIVTGNIDHLHCVLPCKEQADKWPVSSRELYHSILQQADSIIYVSRAFRKNCMLERNRFLVDHAAVLLAVYSGSGRSGTGATVNYARKLGREMFVIDPLTLTVTHEGGTV